MTGIPIFSWQKRRARPPEPLSRTCVHCAHFQNEAAALEAEIAGLATMSSGYAAVRDRDGLCTRHGRYLTCRSSCAEFEARTPF
jgi:hypothetical protein